jgi:hypothetical protein
LALTGEDGSQLLEATEKRFDLTLCSEEQRCAKHSEGWAPFPFRFTSLLNAVETTVREFTVGDLFEAVRKAKGIPK